MNYPVLIIFAVLIFGLNTAYGLPPPPPTNFVVTITDESNQPVQMPASLQITEILDGETLLSYGIDLFENPQTVSVGWYAPSRAENTEIHIVAVKQGYANSGEFVYKITSQTPTEGKLFDHTFVLNTEETSKVIEKEFKVTSNGKSYTLTTKSSSNVESVEFAEKENLDLGALGLIYEQCQSGLEDSAVIDRMKSLVSIIENSIKTGLEGTTYEDRILPQQSHLINNAKKRNKILQNSIINQIIANVSAIMESKSAMEVVVANPSAGSCGVVGGVLKAVADDINATHDELIKAYFATGIIGVYFAMGPGFSAEEHGCQVECGASAGMAAAGIVQLFGGTARQAVDAASMAIQNMIGLVCDPIADRVEAPCLGKNVSAAVNALSSATMSCAGYNALIPLNEVLKTVSSVSSQMPTCVKCTGKGGLATTNTACSIKEKLALKNTIVTA